MKHKYRITKMDTMKTTQNTVSNGCVTDFSLRASQSISLKVVVVLVVLLVIVVVVSVVILCKNVSIHINKYLHSAYM